MSAEDETPYALCGCIRVGTEAEARAIRDFLREVLGAGGFAIEHVEVRPDGAEIRRKIA